MQDDRQAQNRGEYGATQHPDKTDAPQLSAVRQPGEPSIGGLKIALDRREVGARLIGLAQGEAMFEVVRHAPEPAFFWLPYR
jgi:hypothetical protein